MFLRSIRSVLNAINFYLFVGLTVLLNILPGEAITIDGVYDGKVYLCNNEENRTVTIKFDKNENPSDYTFDWYDSKSPTTSLGTDSSKVLSVNDAENEICVKITHKGTNESNIQKFKVARSNQISIQNIYDDYKNNWLTNQNLKLCKKSSVKIHPELSNSDLSSVVYEWSKDVDKNGNKTKEKVGGNSEFLNVASPGNYHLTVSQYGCKVSKDFSISAADMVSLSGNDGLCDDEGELNLSASGMNSYEWKGNNIAPNGSSATVKETGTYTVIGKQEYNNAICWDTLTFVVKKKEALDLQVEGVTALCPGKTETSLTANVTNDDASDLDYSWSDDNGHDGSGGDLSNIGVGTYTITVSSNSGNKCPSTKVITVAKVDTVSKPQISGKLLICSGSSASLTIKNLDLATCNWYYGDSLCFVTHQGSSERAEPKWIGDYHVVGYTLGGCESKPTKFSLSKVNLPAVVLDTVKPCGDAPVSVKATYADSLTFNWGVSINKQPKSYVGTAVKNGGDYINTIEVSQTSKITAKVVDKNTNCQNSISDSVIFLSYPKIKIEGIPVFCKGSQGHLHAVVTNQKDTSSYFWKSPTGQVTRSGYMAFSDTGEYVFSAANAYGCLSMDTVHVTSIDKPTIKVDKSASNLCGNSSHVTLTASGADTYTWESNSSVSTIGSTYTVSSAGDYKVTGTMSSGCSNSISVNVASKALPNFNKKEVDPICAGHSGYITVGIDKPVSTYIWPDGTQSTESKFKVDKSGDYAVTAVDTDGCSVKVTIPVVVHPNPIAKINNLHPAYFCQNGSVVLNAQTGNYYSYSWNNEDYTNQSEYEAKTAGNYILIVKETQYFCTDTDTITVRMNTLPTVILAADSSEICGGRSVQLTATSKDGADQFAWAAKSAELAYSFGTDIKMTYTPTATTTYYVRGKNDKTGCESEPVSTKIKVDEPFTIRLDGSTSVCAGVSSTVTASGGADNYEWKVGTNTPLVGNTYQVKGNNDYEVMVHATKSGSVCVADTKFTVKVEQNPTIKVRDTFFCEKSSVEVTPTGTDYYTLSQNNAVKQDKATSFVISTEGQYSVVGKSAGGCESQPISLNVEKKALPKVDILAADFICADSTAKLTANVLGIAPFKYSWSAGTPQTTDLSVNIVNTYGTFSVTVADDFGCGSMASKTLTQKKPVVTISDKAEFCSDSTLILTAKSMDAVNYYWEGSSSSSATYTATATGTYTVIGKDANGCGARVSKSVTKRPSLTVTISPEKRQIAICKGQLQELTASANRLSTYKWGLGGTDAVATIKVSPTTETSYSVLATDDIGCKAFDTITVKVNDLPEVLLRARDTICQGDTVGLLASGADTYNWNITNAGTGAQVIDRPTASLVYSVVGTKTATGCQSIRATKQVTVDMPFSVVLAGAKAMCDGASTTIKASGADKYVWSDGSQSDNITISKEGDYSVVATKSKSVCVDTEKFYIEVKPNPVVSVRDTYLCKGGTVVVTPQGANGYYELTNDGNNKQTNPSSFVIGTASDKYQILGFSDFGCKSRIVSFKVEEKELPQLEIPDVVLCTNGDATLEVKVKGADPFSYEWDDSPILNGPTNGITSRYSKGEVSHTVVVTDKFGCKNSLAKTLTPTHPEVKLEAQKTEICTDSLARFTASGNASDYYWQDGKTKGTAVFDFNMNKEAAFGMNTVKVVGVDNNGCKDSASLEVKMRTVPVITMPDSVSFCEFDSVQLSAQLNRTASRYVWDGNTSQESTYWAGKNKTYTAQAYDDLNCPSAVYDIKVHEILRPKMSIKSSSKDYVCENGDPITLTAETLDPLRPADRYEWNNGSTESSISVNKGSTFVVWGYLHGCVSAPDTLPIAFKMAPKVSIKGVKEICTDSSATLLAQGTAAHYFWNGSASADTLYEVTKTGDYTLVGADTFGCKAYDKIHVQQRNVPLLSVKDSVSFCEFDSVQLSAQLNRTASRYVWDGNTSQESTYWAGKNKIYTAQAYDDLNCPSAVYDIKVHEILRPKMSIKSSAKDYVCENGDPITLTAETPDPLRPADRYEWNNGSTESSISVNKGSTFVVWGYLHGCVSAPDTLPIAFKVAPKVSIKGEKEICTDSSATLLAQGTAAHYFWNGSASADTLYKVTKTGDYTLVGADTFGCKAYDTLHVQQRDVPLLSVKDSVSFCEFDSLLLTASLNRTAAFYVWDGDTIQSANHWLNQDRLYTVKAYDDLMCPSELKNVKSHIVLRPVVKISATKDYVCENGDPVTLTASQPDATRPADAYLWEPNGETASAIQVYKGDTYRLYGSLHGCVSQPDTYAIEQKYIPKLSIAEGPVAKYCDMLSVTLHAISPTATSYSWSPKTSTADTLNTNEENTYTVVVKDTFGCVNSAKVRTEAIKGPQVRIDGDTIICQHNFALLTAICSECDSLAWSTGSDETSIEAYKAGDYIVVGYNGVGCPSAPAIHHLAVRDIPQIAITGITDITSNDSTILTADVAGEEPFLFNWAPTKETTQSIVVRGSDMRTLTRIYTATVFDRWGCYNYALAKITKHSINLTGKTAFCQGDSSKLTASGDDVTSYLWSTGDTSNSITVNKGGEYSIITGHTNGMIDTFTFTVTVHGLPIVRFLGNPYFCKGDSTIITAKADSSTYLWNTGTKDSSVIVRDSGLYSVVATTVYGCVDSDSIYVKEYPLPIVTIAGPDSVLEEGSIFLDAGGALSYHWADPDTVAQRVEVFKAMRYRVMGTDVNGCKNTAVHDVAMIPIPHPLINDTTNGHTVICDGDHYKLIASGAETYTWDDGEKTDTINVTESRIYTVTGCLSNGQCRSTTFSVEVSPLPKMLRIDGDTKFCPDTFSVLTAHAVDDSLISHYFWSTGENTQSIKVTDADSFSVHALSVYGCLSDTLSVVTSLYGTPVITFDGLREICQNSSTEITAHGGTRYVWLGENIYTPEITITEPGDYTARVIDGNGCHSDSTIFIQDMGLPKLRIAGSSSFCEGDSVRLRIDGDKFTENFYHWNTGSESDSIIISKPGVYVASISNHAGCETFDTITVVEYPNPVITIDGPSMVCFGDSVPLTCTELSGNEIVRYEWSHGPTVQTVYVSESDSFSVIATDVHGCISNVDSQYVWQRVPKPVNITGDFNICVEREDTAVMVASCPEVVYYKWVSEQTGDTLIADSNAYGAIAPGKYRAIATDQYGCSSYLTAQVTGRKNPKVKIRGAEIPVCDRDTATLTADVDNDVRYKWNTGDTTKNILCPKSGVFMLYGVSRFDCYSSDTANLILNDIPAMETSKNLGFCPGKSTDVTVSGAQSYLWSNGSTSDHAEFNAAGSEFVIGTDKYGCHKRINFNIYQFHVPEIMIMASPSTFERTHPVVNFDVTSNDTLDNCMFKWTLGDGNTEEAQSFAYTYDITNQRRFFIGLLMTTTDGCEKSVQTSVACDLDIPNTITPNGDGINDVFMKGCKVEIYDRHGVTIHKGDNGWDGRLKDGRVVADTYFYVLTDITEEKYYGYLTVRVQ